MPLPSRLRQLLTRRGSQLVRTTFASNRRILFMTPTAQCRINDNGDIRVQGSRNLLRPSATLHRLSKKSHSHTKLLTQDLR
jgi:hypothetical protein